MCLNRAQPWKGHRDDQDQDALCSLALLQHGRFMLERLCCANQRFPAIAQVRAGCLSATSKRGNNATRSRGHAVGPRTTALAVAVPVAFWLAVSTGTATGSGEHWQWPLLSDARGLRARWGLS